MSRKSFTLKKYESDSGPASAGSASVFGSYLQYPIGSDAALVGLVVKTDEDTQLKSDDLAPPSVLSEPTIPGTLSPTISFFESQVLDYNEILLTWDLDLASTLTPTLQPTRVLIVYSDLGEPQTIAEGLLLADTATTSRLTHYVPPGKWAYYSMFIRYENVSGSIYYDRVATMAELAPYNYGCSDDMYRKIPEYYRLLDEELDSGNGGPLKRMISLFGFEADRVRTAIDYLITCKDPLLAHSQVLDILAKDLTVDIRSDELGAAKLRNILHSVGLIRRSLGTPASIALIVQAATGSEAAFNLEGPLPAIDIYAQRVNMLKDPNIIGGAAGSFVGGTPTTKTFTSQFDANGPILTYDVWNNGSASTSVFALSYSANGASVPSPTATYSGGAASVPALSLEEYEGGTPFSSLSPYDEFSDADRRFDEEINEQYWQFAPDPLSGGSLSYLKTIDNLIPVFRNESFFFSMHGDFVENAQDEVVRVALYGISSGAASAGYSGTVDDYLICNAEGPIVIAGIKYWKLTIPPDAVGWQNSSLTIFLNTTANISKGFQKMLLEKVVGGRYFDGDSTEGGWVVNYSTGQRISDYRWYNPDNPSSDVEGPEQQTYSVYNSNYKKTRSLADRYLPLILPVKQTSYADVVYSNDPTNITTKIWSLNWNVIPGLGAITPGVIGPLIPA